MQLKSALIAIRFSLARFGALGKRFVGGDHGVFVCLSNDVEVWHGDTSCFLLCQRLEGQQLVTVVFVLLLPCGDFGGETVGDVVAECVEAVKNGNNTFLLFQGWNWNRKGKEHRSPY